MRRLGAAAAVALACFAATAAPTARQEGQKVDVSGMWSFENETDQGKTSATVALKQSGEELSGLYSSAVMADADLTGTVKGRAIEFWFTADVRGRSVEMYFAGEIDPSGAMKGTADLGPLGAGTFVATRKR